MFTLLNKKMSNGATPYSNAAALLKLHALTLLLTILITAATTSTSSASRPQLINGTVVGQILLSPICPVEHDPPDPACAPKPYQTTVNILKISNRSLYKKITTNTLGKFTFSLPKGSYLVQIPNRSIFPRCNDQNIKVLPRKQLKILIDCDTGIR